MLKWLLIGACTLTCPWHFNLFKTVTLQDKIEYTWNRHSLALWAVERTNVIHIGGSTNVTHYKWNSRLYVNSILLVPCESTGVRDCAQIISRVFFPVFTDPLPACHATVTMDFTSSPLVTRKSSFIEFFCISRGY